MKRRNFLKILGAISMAPLAAEELSKKMVEPVSDPISVGELYPSQIMDIGPIPDISEKVSKNIMYGKYSNGNTIKIDDLDPMPLTHLTITNEMNINVVECSFYVTDEAYSKMDMNIYAGQGIKLVTIDIKDTVIEFSDVHFISRFDATYMVDAPIKVDVTFDILDND